MKITHPNFHSGTRTMARRLPPLNGLRVFEAAARHLSFTRAAQELHVTQAAVSHQIKALEAWLGVRLFRRPNRPLLLSDSGPRYVTPRSEDRRVGQEGVTPVNIQ